MNVLSLFDGLSCGQIALNRAGIRYDNYFASEINKFAIKVTQYNYPNTIQLGDITLVKGSELPKIDLLIGGSPCQGFSHAGKKLNFDDPRSKLFFEYVRLLKETNPTYFLLENVNMKQEWKDIISDLLGVQPIFINSKLVSAQDRKRLYWTNIPNITIPEDRHIKFSDISNDGWYCGSMRGRRVNPKTNSRDDYNYDIKIKQYIECRIDDKSNCLTTVIKDNVAVKTNAPRRNLNEAEYRWLTPNEYEALQTVPKDYTACVSDNQRRTMMGNGWTVDVVSHIFNFLPK
jgi:DNA (cytosine-5)-methyltransferase 3A